MEKKNISIILTVHNQDELLRQNLPQFLEVAREAGAEVIVVNDMSEDDTADILTQMQAEYPDVLYSTFLPHSVVVNPSRKRLALTIGAKAAKTERVVLADIQRPPVSTAWVVGLADGEAAMVYSGKALTHVSGTELDDFRSVISKAERQSGKGHCGRWFRRRRGLYDALAVNKRNIFEAIQLFDRPFRGFNLLGLRLKVWCRL
jgi:glycosyltransferase involved in cell wall biosynthesis